MGVVSVSLGRQSGGTSSASFTKPQPESEAGSLEAEGGDDQELQVASTAVPDTPLPQAPNEKEMVS